MGRFLSAVIGLTLLCPVAAVASTTYTTGRITGAGSPIMFSEQNGQVSYYRKGPAGLYEIDRRHVENSIKQATPEGVRMSATRNMYVPNAAGTQGIVKSIPLADDVLVPKASIARMARFAARRIPQVLIASQVYDAITNDDIQWLDGSFKKRETAEVYPPGTGWCRRNSSMVCVTPPADDPLTACNNTMDALFRPAIVYPGPSQNHKLCYSSYTQAQFSDISRTQQPTVQESFRLASDAELEAAIANEPDANFIPILDALISPAIKQPVHVPTNTPATLTPIDDVIESTPIRTITNTTLPNGDQVETITDEWQRVLVTATGATLATNTVTLDTTNVTTTTTTTTDATTGETTTTSTTTESDTRTPPQDGPDPVPDTDARDPSDPGEDPEDPDFDDDDSGSNNDDDEPFVAPDFGLPELEAPTFEETNESFIESFRQTELGQAILTAADDIPDGQASCIAPSFEWNGQTYTFQVMCDLWIAHVDLIRAFAILGWAFFAVVIFLRA